MRAVGGGGRATQAYNYMSPHLYVNNCSCFLSYFSVLYKHRATSRPRPQSSLSRKYTKPVDLF